MGIELSHKINEVKNSFSKTVREEEGHKKDGAFPRESEPGMIHPFTDSAIKIRENGVIDLFVGTDNGLRIDPETQTINLLSNISKQRSYYRWETVKKNATMNVGHDHIHNVGNDEVHNIKKDWTIHVGGNANIVSEDTIYMEAREKIHMKSPHIHLDATMPDQKDQVRPPLGIRFKEDLPYGDEVPYGYRAPYGHYTFEKKADTYNKGFATAMSSDGIWKDSNSSNRYSREEFDDVNKDKNISLRQMDPSLSSSNPPILEVTKQRQTSNWRGPALRKKYQKGKVEVTAAHAVEMTASQGSGSASIGLYDSGEAVRKTSGRDTVHVGGDKVQNVNGNTTASSGGNHDVRARDIYVNARNTKDFLTR